MKKLFLSASTIIAGTSMVQAMTLDLDTLVLSETLKNVSIHVNEFEKSNALETFERLKLKTIEQILLEIFTHLNKKNVSDQQPKVYFKGESSILSGLPSQSQKRLAEFIPSSGRFLEDVRTSDGGGVSVDAPSKFRSVEYDHDRAFHTESRAPSHHPIAFSETGNGSMSKGTFAPDLSRHDATSRFSYPAPHVVDNLIRFSVSSDGKHFIVDGKKFLTEDGKKASLAEIAKKLKTLKHLKKESEEAYLNAMYADQDSEEYVKLREVYSRIDDRIDLLEDEIKDDVKALDEEVTRAQDARQMLADEYGEDYEELVQRAQQSDDHEIELVQHAQKAEDKAVEHPVLEDNRGNRRLSLSAHSSGQHNETDALIRRLRTQMIDEDDFGGVDFDGLMSELKLDDSTEGQERINPFDPKSMVRGIHDWLMEETAATLPEAADMVKDLSQEERDAVLLELSKIKGPIQLEEKFTEETQSIKKVQQETKSAAVIRDNTQRYIDQRGADWSKVKGFEDPRTLDAYIVSESKRYAEVLGAFNDKFAEMRYEWLNKELENHPNIKEKEKNRQSALRALAEEALEEVCDQYYLLSERDRGILRLNAAYRVTAFDLGGTKPAENPSVNLDETPDYVAKVQVAEADFSDTLLDTLTPKEILALWGRMNKEGMDRPNSGFPKRTNFYKNLTNKVKEFFEDEKDHFDTAVSLKPSQKFEPKHEPFKHLKMHKLMMTKADMMSEALRARAQVALKSITEHYKSFSHREKSLLLSPSGTLYNTAHLILVGEYDAGSDDFDAMFSPDRVGLKDLTSDELIAFRFYLEENFMNKDGASRAKLTKCYSEVKKLVDAMFVDGAGKEEERITLKPKTFKEEEPFRKARLLRASLAKKEDFIRGIMRKADELKEEILHTIEGAPVEWSEQLLAMKAYAFMLKSEPLKITELQGLIQKLSNKEKIVFFAEAVRQFGTAVFEKTKLKAEMEKLFKDGADKFDPAFILELKKSDALDEACFKALPIPKKAELEEQHENHGAPPPPPPPPMIMGGLALNHGPAAMMGDNKNALFDDIKRKNKAGLKSTGRLEQEARERDRLKDAQQQEALPEDLSLSNVLYKIRDRVLGALQLKKVREEAQELMDQWGDTYSEVRTQVKSTKNEVLEARLRRFKIVQRLNEGGEAFMNSKEGGLLNDELVKLDDLISVGIKSDTATQNNAYAEAMKPIREKMAARLLEFAEDAVIKDAPKAGLSMVRDLMYLNLLKMSPQEAKKQGFMVRDLTLPKQPLAMAALANVLRGIHFDKEGARSKVEAIMNNARNFESQYMARMNEVYRQNLSKTLTVFDRLFENKTRSAVANKKIDLLRRAKTILETKRSHQISDEMLQDIDLINMPYFVVSALYGHVTSEATFVDESTEARIKFIDALTTTYYQVALPEVAKDMEKEMEAEGEFMRFEKALEAQKQTCARAIRRAEDENERSKTGPKKGAVNEAEVMTIKKPVKTFTLKKLPNPEDLMRDLERMKGGISGLRNKTAPGANGASTSGAPMPPPPPPPGFGVMNGGDAADVMPKLDTGALFAAITKGVKLRKTGQKVDTPLNAPPPPKMMPPVLNLGGDEDKIKQPDTSALFAAIAKGVKLRKTPKKEDDERL